jgi:serine/threonine-protein kinase RsbW
MTEPTNGSGGAIGAAPSGGRLGAIAERGISYPAVGPAVSDARAHVTRWLRAGGEDEVLIGDIAIALTEACTNAVVHAYRDGADGNGDGRHFHVVTGRADGVVTVTVSDSGVGMRPRPDSPGLGLGVSLMAALSDHVVMGTQPDGSGTVVAMSFTEAGSRSRLRGLD